MPKRDEVLRESNSAFKDANNALKELVNSLKNERAMLLEKNKALEAKLAIKRLKQVKNQEPSDESSLLRPRSQWLASLNTRTACVLVCKHWYVPASQALYSDIVLHRMGQISALARTLRSTAAIYAPDRSRFVRSIYMNECIVLPAAASVVKEDLTFLLHRCTNLRTFTLRSCSRFLGGDLTVDRDHRDWFNPIWYWDTDEDAPGSALAERCATSLEELTLVDPLVGQNMKRIHRFLSVATNLRKLILSPLPEQCDLSQTLSALPPIPLSLAALEDLQLPNTDDAFRTYVQEKWSSSSRSSAASTSPKSSWKRMAYISNLCPALEHLVLPNMPIYSPQSIIRSPSLRYLDMWGPTPKRRVVELMLEMGRMCALPALRGIRILPEHDEAVLPPRLPLLCHPEDVDEGGTRVRMFLPGVYILQTPWALLPTKRTLDPEYDDVVFEEDPWADSASDTLYQCEEDVEMGGDEEGDEDADELDTASGRQVGEGKSKSVAEEQKADEHGSDEQGEEEEDAEGTEGGTGCDEEEGDEPEKEGEAEREWRFTREELLKRFCESQREDFLFDDE
ncbi:hypothetical protein LXA43DRAFT_1179162 [Ganoderma leucocontextum]|nr:hypothetical protein LXA43DRAFT_1179162 [Ganoderma leucocontextum]